MVADFGWRPAQNATEYAKYMAPVNRTLAEEVERHMNLARVMPSMRGFYVYTARLQNRMILYNRRAVRQKMDKTYTPPAPDNLVPPPTPKERAAKPHPLMPLAIALHVDAEAKARQATVKPSPDVDASGANQTTLF